MSTQKINPNPDALERQPTRQRRRSVGKKVGALVVAAAISLAAVVLILATRAGGTTTTSAPEPPTVASRIASGPFLLNLRTGERTPLPEDLVGGFDYRASPDGRRVAYGTCCDAADSITVADLEGTEFHQFTPTKGPDLGSGGWGERRLGRRRHAHREPGVSTASRNWPRMPASSSPQLVGPSKPPSRSAGRARSYSTWLTRSGCNGRGKGSAKCTNGYSVWF
jgi:hypothetical protein